MAKPPPSGPEGDSGPDANTGDAAKPNKPKPTTDETSRPGEEKKRG